MARLEGRVNKAHLLKNPIHFLAFGFGFGLAARAPGTFGTVAAIPVYLVLSMVSPSFYIGFVLFFFCLGVWLCGKSAQALGIHDHPGIVWDEIVGFLIAMLGAATTWQTILAGFILFRLFDILKPWPIRLIDKHMTGGMGIMLDDALAGFMAALLLTISGKFGLIS